MLFSHAELETRTGGSVTADMYALLHDYVAALVVLEGGTPYTGLTTDNLTVVRAVALAAAAREFDNPQHFERATIGNFSFGGAPTTTFTADERRTIRLAYGSSGGVYSVRLSSPADVAYPA